MLDASWVGEIESFHYSNAFYMFQLSEFGTLRWTGQDLIKKWWEKENPKNQVFTNNQVLENKPRVLYQTRLIFEVRRAKVYLYTYIEYFIYVYIYIYGWGSFVFFGWEIYTA